MVRLHLLGPPEVRNSRGVVPLPPRLLALAGYLALAPPDRSVRRDVLLATFWPDSDLESARDALNQAIYELRRSLGRETVESRGKGELALGAAVYADVREFRARLADGHGGDALELYRGDLLEGLHISRAWPFERWLADARHRLRRDAAAAAVAQAGRVEVQGRPTAVAAWLARALELDPVDETVARRMILLHLETGDRAAAVREYQRIVRALRLELDLEPAAETLRLAEMFQCAGTTRDVRSGAADVTMRPTAARRIAGELLDRVGELAPSDRTANAVARELLRQATRIDPALEAARAAHASALADWVLLFGGPPRAARLAVDEADAAIQLDPTSFAAHLGRGFGLEAMTRFGDAAGAFRDALRLRPREPEAVSRYGRVLMYAGDVAASRRVARKAAMSRDEDADLLLQLGMADFVLDREDEAREATASALRLRPAFQYAEAAWGFYELAHGHFDAAATALNRLLSREPDSFLGHFFRGDLALVQRDFDAALAAYQRCCDIDPAGRPVGLYLSARTQAGFVHVRAGDAALGLRMLDDAEADVRQVLGAGAEFGGFFVELAIVAAARGDTNRALAHLTTAYRNGYLQYHLIDRHPVFDELRARPAYRGLLAAIQDDVARQGRRAD
ncbi:MAG TPA: BTAD domain-containing putative transcriptional regulator [Gemmatimonadaceae bacterium]|nr:BTAD domain-containing putative transcriptional regulator [Gemmatimonadaceae bacterium]